MPTVPFGVGSVDFKAGQGIPFYHPQSGMRDQTGSSGLSSRATLATLRPWKTRLRSRETVVYVCELWALNYLRAEKAFMDGRKGYASWLRRNRKIANWLSLSLKIQGKLSLSPKEQFPDPQSLNLNPLIPL